jgi:hypothetical protein
VSPREYAPQQAWWWADRRYGAGEAAVVGATIRLGRCLDLLDPTNVGLLRAAHADLVGVRPHAQGRRDGQVVEPERRF